MVSKHIALNLNLVMGKDECFLVIHVQCLRVKKPSPRTLSRAKRQLLLCCQVSVLKLGRTVDVRQLAIRLHHTVHCDVEPRGYAELGPLSVRCPFDSVHFQLPF